jgi:hypothetical protein
MAEEEDPSGRSADIYGVMNLTRLLSTGVATESHVSPKGQPKITMYPVVYFQAASAEKER